MPGVATHSRREQVEAVADAHDVAVPEAALLGRAAVGGVEAGPPGRDPGRGRTTEAPGRQLDQDPERGELTRELVEAVRAAEDVVEVPGGPGRERLDDGLTPGGAQQRLDARTVRVAADRLARGASASPAASAANASLAAASRPRSWVAASGSASSASIAVRVSSDHPAMSEGTDLNWPR